MIQFILWVMFIWFLIHYGILGAFLIFCANVFMAVAGLVA